MWEIPGVREFPVFLVSATMLALTPGQDTLYVMGRALAQGRKAGVISVAGILSGALVHLLAGAGGLSALLAASPSAFTVVKWAGGAYLIYLGIRMLMGSGKAEVVESARTSSTAALWRQGFITNVLNPKVALFCLAFIPQFIVPGSPHTVPVFLFLGICFFIIGGLWLLVIVAFAAAIGGKLQGGWNAALNRLAGVLFIGLGLRLLFQHL
ncbi:LysE family translocator [Luteolibacter sp. SL250]|uniref:LysE family translocator n=1 Tax=Luteolibacter sp. SL250 TaxID=2995170 RepID=UPI00226F77B7|nr:LysE family translocator [Luteolibacter sp. SL250]WAC19128.1 LysE family translocator [Luteolibacter sp. SL250]